MGESKEQWLIAENERLTQKNEQLRRYAPIDSARQSAITQCAALAGYEVLTMAINEV